MQKQIDISGLWQAALLPKGKDRKESTKEWYSRNPQYNCQMRLPGTTALAELGKAGEESSDSHLSQRYPFEGIAYLKREIEWSEADCGKRAVLYLERTRITDVWVNGCYAGQRDSLAAAHCHEVGHLLMPGVNTIEIGVNNVDYPVPGGHMTSPDTQSNWNGIVGEISLHVYDGLWMKEVTILPSMKEEKVSLEILLESRQDVSEEIMFRVRLRKPGERSDSWETKTLTVQKEIRLPDGTADKGLPVQRRQMMLEFPVESPKGWEEHTPYLYLIEVTAEGLIGTDTWKGSFGFRDLSHDGKNFLINGQPIYLRGKHDGMTFPKTGFAPMEKEEWIRVFTIAREYGINHYRFHTCCPPRAAFEAADELGIYLQPELPFWGTVRQKGEEGYQEEAQTYLVEEGFRILKEFGNHPSFAAFSLGNELWGSVEELNRILALYKRADRRHWYTQGSNNFQFSPQIAPEDDFYSGVRFDRERLFRGSYAMCDAPQGRIQTAAPCTDWDYDEMIRPGQNGEAAGQAEGKEKPGKIQIQYGTVTKEVELADSQVLLPRIPVVSHEIGQYSMYPDYRDIPKYDGALRADCLEQFQDRLDRKGMSSLAERFFQASGALAVQCYKEELEAAFRSGELAGFQVLDLQDFMGQGIAMVGILNAFMENKGLITPEKWRRFCSDAVLLGRFDGYVRVAGERMPLECGCSWYRSRPSGADRLLMSLTVDGEAVWRETRELGGFEKNGLYSVGRSIVEFPERQRPYCAALTIRLEKLEIENEYEFWVYPQIDAIDAKGQENSRAVCITTDESEAEQRVKEGERVLCFPENEAAEGRLEIAYCTDFWCYPMFRSISEGMKKPLPIGTLGLTIQNEHPAFRYFPCRSFTTPQWYELTEGAYAGLLDREEVTLLVQAIDNVERNHRIGLLYEKHPGDGHMIVCFGGLLKLQRETDLHRSLPARWLIRSLLAYISEGNEV